MCLIRSHRKQQIQQKICICFLTNLSGYQWPHSHYGGVKMGAIASQITSLTIVYSTVYSDADQRKHQSSASLAFVRGIHRGPVNSPHKWPVTRKMFPFDDVIMTTINWMIQFKMCENIKQNLATARAIVMQSNQYFYTCLWVSKAFRIFCII